MASHLKKRKFFEEKRKDFVNKLENFPQPPWKYLVLFFLIILSRFFLENIFSNYNGGVISISAFLLVLFFYCSILFSGIILLHFFTKEKFVKLFKITVPFFGLTLFPPIIDFVLNFGKPLQMSYLVSSNNLLLDFLTIGGASLKGITPGIRIELLIFLALTFYYLQIKNPKFLQNLFYTFLMYCMIFTYMLTPLLISPILQLVNVDLFDFWNKSIITFYLLLLLVQLSIIFYFSNKELFRAILSDLRPLRVIHFLSMFVLGVFLANHLHPINPSFYFILDLILAPLAIIFSLLSIIIQNNVFDFWIDLVSNKSRPLQSKKINLREYSQIYIVFLLLAISFAITSGFVALIGVGVLLLCYYFYSTPPFRLKRVTLFSKLLISISSLGLVLTGFVLANGSLLSFPLEVLILFLVGFSFAINFIDIKDYLGDKKEKIKTLPVLLGLKKSKLLIGFFFILAYGLSFFVIKNPLSIFPIIIFALIQFILINKKNYNEVPIFITYFISVITLAMLM